MCPVFQIEAMFAQPGLFFVIELASVRCGNNFIIVVAEHMLYIKFISTCELFRHRHHRDSENDANHTNETDNRIKVKGVTEC